MYQVLIILFAVDFQLVVINPANNKYADYILRYTDISPLRLNESTSKVCRGSCHQEKLFFSNEIDNNNIKVNNFDNGTMNLRVCMDKTL